MYLPVFYYTRVYLIWYRLSRHHSYHLHWASNAIGRSVIYEQAFVYTSLQLFMFHLAWFMDLLLPWAVQLVHCNEKQLQLCQEGNDFVIPLRRPGDIVISSSVLSLSVYMYVCNNFVVYAITWNILEQSAPVFLWALSGLLASTSLHLGSVTLVLGVVFRVLKNQKSCGRGISIFYSSSILILLVCLFVCLSCNKI